jgi:integrase
MGVIVKQRKDKGPDYWVVVNHQGRRASLKIGDKKAANIVKMKLEAQLAMGDYSCLERRGDEQTFKEYCEEQVELDKRDNKPSTKQTYLENRERYVFAKFGDRKLSTITRDEVNKFLKELKEHRNPRTGKPLSRATIQLAISSLRIPLNMALDDGLIKSNPAARLGFKKGKTGTEALEAKAMDEEQVVRCLEAALDDKYYPLFLIGFRCGLREGENIALRWKDIQFGKGESDRNRHIFVQQRWYRNHYALPKGGEKRKVPMSRELWRVLYELRDERLLTAIEMGRESIDDDLLFPSPKIPGRPIGVWTLDEKHWRKILKKAGLGHYRLHDMRHTYGSILIQNGAPLPVVKDQMGHASIQVTVDTYCHLLSERSVEWADKLDELSPVGALPSATQAQPEEVAEMVSDSKHRAVAGKQHKHRVSEGD